ncbi:NAD(P)-dependent oxidoreductase [Streptomyces sp. NPDC004856]|uniref:NAD-dependent epimerase/dehydratase family protein n=2 Tax=Streptomyces TaxID=1883 RepID=UPI00339DCE20
MHIVVTGAAGRVGRAVTAQLVERGHQVTGIDMARPASPVEGVRYVTAAFSELEPGDQRLAGIDAVAHLGAMMSWRDADAAAMFEANVVGTFRLIEAAAPHGVRRLVLASTGEVYPENAPAYLPLDEAHPRNATTHYGMTKVLSEDLADFAGRKYGMAVTTLRFAHTQDPAELLDPDSFFSGPRFFLHRRLEKERAAGNTDVVRQLEAWDGGEALIAPRRADGRPVRMGILATEDLARGVVLALEADASVDGVFGLGPDESTDLAEFARALGAAAGLPVVDVTVPNTAADYWTLNARARELLGFRQRIGAEEMVAQAVEARKRRHDGA